MVSILSFALFLVFSASMCFGSPPKGQVNHHYCYHRGQRDDVRDFIRPESGVPHLTALAPHAARGFTQSAEKRYKVGVRNGTSSRPVCKFHRRTDFGTGMMKRALDPSPLAFPSPSPSRPSKTPIGYVWDTSGLLPVQGSNAGG